MKTQLAIFSFGAVFGVVVGMAGGCSLGEALEKLKRPAACGVDHAKLANLAAQIGFFYGTSGGSSEELEEQIKFMFANPNRVIPLKP